ncbi:YcjX family protein [Rheinheimera texasensis]|uniref:YcjX family protein n=1 Tax=Rheinheimera texasensis TaxID=306205 RepID=UPI0032B158A5
MNFQLPDKARILGQRLANQHLRLGITGISGAGKTAFLTSLIRQLTQAPSSQLPFFQVMQQQRYLGGQPVRNAVAARARFPFELNLQQLQQGQWPASTTALSQITLELRYKPQHPLKQKLLDWQTLTLEITDYPGEWLLDLPMLQLDYPRWCQQVWALLDSEPVRDLAAQFRQELAQTELTADPLVLQQLTDSYQQLLLEIKRRQLAVMLQPGRLLRPAELQGAPLLQLFPLLPEQLANSSALKEQLQRHFQDYQQKVVLPFYRDYFAGLDRQVIMADCLGALNRGHQALTQLQQALMLIMQHFSYGPESWWRRLFKPRIDKVLFVASKADLLTPDQHRNLLLLLQQMLQQPLYQQRYQQCETEALAVAAVVSAEFGQVQTADGQTPCLRGHLASTGELQTWYPGEVPLSMPSPQLFAHHQFAFPEFLPLVGPTPVYPRQLRMDQVLQFLLGDHLR